MVDDILLTPEEQDEKAKQWLKDNGLAIVVGIGLGLGAVFGYNAYTAKQISDAEQASFLFQQVMEAVGFSENADIQEQLNILKTDHSATPYAAKAALLRARQLSVSDAPASLVELQWVIDNAKEQGVQHAARIRKAKIELSLGNNEEAKALASIADTSGFDSHYQEILGDVSVAEGKYAVAKEYYQQSLDNLGAADASYRGVLSIKLNRLPVEDSPEPNPATEQADAAEVNSDG